MRLLESNHDPSVCFWGAALDTANLGVSALGISVLHGFAVYGAGACLTLFDFGRGAGSAAYRIEGANLAYLRCGAYHTKRFYRRECLWNIRISARLGGRWNVAAKSIRSANSVLDISGGDSFTDMYGPWRFRAVTLPKLIATDNRIPLLLLPQTYGPFKASNVRRTAQKIVRASSMAWSRDARSFEVLQELLGEMYDPLRHRIGVDVAFGLPTLRPAQDVLAGTQDWFDDGKFATVGLNVSGLLMNRPKHAAEQYGLKADYREVILALVLRFLEKSDVRLLLIPHVVTPPGHYESDIEACEFVLANLDKSYLGRVAVSPVLNDPREVKWIISQCDWFCGTRMHSTIAALSSGVPTAAISYSPKTLGVFESCHQGMHVADPRVSDSSEIVEQLWQSWLDREQARSSLATTLPYVLSLAREQMEEIVTQSTNSR